MGMQWINSLLNEIRPYLELELVSYEDRVGNLPDEANTHYGEVFLWV